MQSSQPEKLAMVLTRLSWESGISTTIVKEKERVPAGHPALVESFPEGLECLRDSQEMRGVEDTGPGAGQAFHCTKGTGLRGCLQGKSGLDREPSRTCPTV